MRGGLAKEVGSQGIRKNKQDWKRMKCQIDTLHRRSLTDPSGDDGGIQELTSTMLIGFGISHRPVPSVLPRLLLLKFRVSLVSTVPGDKIEAVVIVSETMLGKARWTSASC